MQVQILKRRGGHLVRVFIGLDPLTGKRIYHNRLVTGTKKEAQKVGTALEHQRHMGEFALSPTRLTLAEYLEEWKEKAARPSVRGRTFRDYEGLLRRYVIPLIGARRLVDVSPMDVQSVIAAMLARGLSPRTVRYTHAVLGRALGQAVRWRYTRYNPARDVELPKRVHREMLALTKEEAQRFLAAAEGSKHYLLFAMLLGTGLRPGEAVALKWGDLDTTGRQLSVQRSASPVKGGTVFSEPKTARGRRNIELPEYLVNQLLVRRGDASGDALIFPGRDGKPIDARSLASNHFKPVLELAGLPREFRLYDLRHAHATLLLLAGENPKIVSERLGHASVMLTLDTYSHVLPGMQAESAKKLDAMLFRPVTTELTRVTN